MTTTLGHPQLHVKYPAVFWSLLANTPIPRLGGTKGVQIIYFIKLFRHLDLKFLYDKVDPQDEPGDDVTFIPPLDLPLRGMCSIGVGLLKDMNDLFGGIRSRYLDIFNVGGTRLLLCACTETLETLRLHPTDPRSKQHTGCNLRVSADNSTTSCLLDFDLFRIESFGYSGSRCNILTAHRGLVGRISPQFSSRVQCRPSHPPFFPRSSPFIGTLTSVA